MPDNDVALISLVLIVLGFYLAYLYGRKTKKFRWREYFAILVWPLLFIIFLGLHQDVKIFLLFFLSAIVGTTFEYLFGFMYEKTLNQKLWKYNRYSIGGYTSLLSIPIWGIAGIVFWLLGKHLGI